MAVIKLKSNMAIKSTPLSRRSDLSTLQSLNLRKQRPHREAKAVAYDPVVEALERK